MELYQSIYENTKHMTVALDDTQKANAIQLIPRLDQKGQDLLFFLIRMYHNQQSQDITFQLPYTGTAEKSDSTTKDIEFDLNVFPPQLQHMVFLFTRMHYDYISYESIRK